MEEKDNGTQIYKIKDLTSAFMRLKAGKQSLLSLFVDLSNGQVYPTCCLADLTLSFFC